MFYAVQQIQASASVVWKDQHLVLIIQQHLFMQGHGRSESQKLGKEHVFPHLGQEIPLLS